jgi:hypothetical protein
MRVGHTGKYRCAGCGKEVDHPPYPGNKHVYCTKKCFELSNGVAGGRAGTTNQYLQRAWRTFNRFETGFHCKPFPNRREISACYRNEARAMIEGKNWQEKNRCVKLPGDA